MNVVFWIGRAWEPWNPETVYTSGSGGSELACVELARGLANKHEVTVYGECDGLEGRFEGVNYLDYRKVRQIDCDVFIVSRQPWALAELTVNAKEKWLWVHDAHCGLLPIVYETIKLFDKILCLSKWHREYFLSVYPEVNASRVIVTRNGITTNRYKDPYRSKTNRLIYSSAPDRGLDALLDLLPYIQGRVPDVQLDVCYGFDVYRKAAVANGDENALALVDRLSRRIKMFPNVHFHGRVSQAELAEHFLKAKLWAYPTAFWETSCITAMEAQAAGAVPVTTRMGALAETAKAGVLIDPPNDSIYYRKVFVNNVCNLLLAEEERQKYVKSCREAAELMDWHGVVHQWDRLIHVIN